MNIGPIQGFGPAGEVQLADASVRVRPSPSSPPEQPADQLLPPTTGRPPNQETPTAQSAPAAVGIQEDEVQLQRDPEAGDQIVVRYLDKTGSVILQIPSSQMLDVSRAIYQEFQKQSKLQEDPGPAPAEAMRKA